MESNQKILQRVTMVEKLCSQGIQELTQVINLCYGIRKEMGDVDPPSPRKGSIRRMKAENLRDGSIIRSIQNKKATAL